MTTQRAVRYRRLALSEQDEDKARVLREIADEAERGVLVTCDWLPPRPLTGSLAAAADRPA